MLPSTGCCSTFTSSSSSVRHWLLFHLILCHQALVAVPLDLIPPGIGCCSTSSYTTRHWLLFHFILYHQALVAVPLHLILPGTGCCSIFTPGSSRVRHWLLFHLYPSSLRVRYRLLFHLILYHQALSTFTPSSSRVGQLVAVPPLHPVLLKSQALVEQCCTPVHPVLQESVPTDPVLQDCCS